MQSVRMFGVAFPIGQRPGGPESRVLSLESWVRGQATTSPFDKLRVTKLGMADGMRIRQIMRSAIWEYDGE